MIKLEKLKQRLDTLDVFVDDPLSGTGESRYFHIVDFPQTVSRGKTSFLIGGTPFLKKSTVIKVEALDSEGEPIFVEPIDATYSEAGYKPISIVSYGDEAQGRCKLIIVAELENFLGGDTGLIGMPVPDEWKGVYNVRWTQEFFLDNATNRNIEPIRFTQHPTVEVSELITPYVTISGSMQDATFTSSSLSVIAITNYDSLEPSYVDGGDFADTYLMPAVHLEDDGTPVITAFRPEHVGGILTIPRNEIRPYSGTDGNLHIENHPPHPEFPYVAQLDPDFQLLSSGSEPVASWATTKDLSLQIKEVMTGGGARARGIGLDWSQYNGLNLGVPFQSESIAVLPFYYKTSEQEIDGKFQVLYYDENGGISQTLATQQDIDSEHPAPFYFPSLATYKRDRFTAPTASATLEYISASFTETPTLKSYAQIKLNHLKTYSGDVHSLKLYLKPSSQAQEMMIAEGNIEEEKKFLIPVSNQQLFFNVGSGDFVSEDFVQAAFTASLNHTPGFSLYDTNLVSTQPTLSFDETVIYNGMHITGSVQGLGDFYKVESRETMSFQAGQEYKFKVKFHAKKAAETRIEGDPDFVGDNTDQMPKAKLQVYMSGSAFNTDHDVHNWSHIDWDTEYPQSTVPSALRSQYDGKRVLGFNMPEWFVGDATFTDPPDESDFFYIPSSPLQWENNFIADNDGDGNIVFYIEAGEFYISSVEVNVASETGFNPTEYTFNVPIEKEIQDDILTFRLEFFNANGEPAILGDEVLRLQSAPTDFSGGNVVLDGNSNLIVGSTFVSNVAGSGIELAGVNSGFIRSVGYEGFTSASSGIGQSGFLIYSGSVLPDSNDNYSGVGLELHAGGDSGSLKFHAKGDESTFEVITPSFLLGKEANNFSYISGSDGHIEISSSNFHLSSSGDVSMQGTVTAQDGEIGGFIISASTLSGSNITLDSNASAIFMSTDPQNYFMDFTPGTGTGESGTHRQDYYVKFGPNFGVKNDGVLVASGAVIEGVLTSSLGLIANWTIGEQTIHKLTDGQFSGLSSQGTARFFAGASDSTGTATGSAPFNVKADGTVTASKGQIGGWNITPSKFEQTGLFEISASELVISSSQFKVKSDGQITGSKVLFDGGLIGGFDITSDYISGSNLLIHKDGRLETSDFASGVRGWRISAEGNGEAEFENATIRGTLSTTTFEKESVNAVGGQLYVANSTAISQSVSATDVTMSVVNVTGFSVGEILTIKKVSGTGFNTEYVQVQSSSRDASDDNELQGKIYVVRGYSGSVGSGYDSSSLGDTPGAATTYTEGQVIASTGKVGSGYMRLNANPNDTTTPYMDIVERTGSAIYDVDLKVRLGDLSGLSQAQLLGTSPASAGFGLYSENVFLTGGINANYGSIGGFGIGNGVLSSSAFFISGSATDNQTFISSSRFDLKASGDVTGSSMLFSGGRIAGWNVTSQEISSGSGVQRIAIEAVTGSISAFDSDGVKRVFVGIKELSDETAVTNLQINPGFDLPAVASNTDLQMTSSTQVGIIPGVHFQASGQLYTTSNKIGAATASLRDEDGNQKLSVHWQAGHQSGLN